MRFWLLGIIHLDGTSYTLHKSLADAKIALFEFVESWWDDELIELYGQLSVLTHDDAIDRYFEYYNKNLGTEGYSIEELPLETPHSIEWEWREKLELVDHEKLDQIICDELLTEPCNTYQLLDLYNDGDECKRAFMDRVLIAMTGWGLNSLLNKTLGLES